MSITLPILLIGVGIDLVDGVANTIELSLGTFSAKQLSSTEKNRLRIVNGLISGVPLANINANSPIDQKP